MKKSLFIRKMITPKRRRTSVHLLLLLIVLSYGGWLVQRIYFPPKPTLGKAPLLFASEDDDPHDRLIYAAINRAKSNLKLSVYTWSDPKLLALLTHKIGLGVFLSIDHDPKVYSILKPLAKGAHLIEKKQSGIFHEKMLVVDDQEVWISSANFTQSSHLLDSNLTLASNSPELACAIRDRQYCACALDGINITYMPLPEFKKEAFSILLDYINGARHSIHGALFSLTHPAIIEAFRKAKERNVDITIASDRKMLLGSGKKSAKTLLDANIPLLSLGSNRSTFHHKFLLIDEKVLLFGSANYSRAAFEKNGESFLIVSPMSRAMTKKIKKVVHAQIAMGNKIDTGFFE